MPINELRHALMRTARQPLSSLLAIGCLALGLAAAIIVYAVITDLLLQPSALPHGERVQLLQLDISGGGKQRVLSSWSYPGFVALRDALAPDMAAIAVTRSPLTLTLVSGGVSRVVETEIVSPGYFDAVGVAPLLGPTLVTGTEPQGIGDARIWLAHPLWRDAFSANPDIIGQAVTLQGASFTIAGVLPEGFAGLSERAALWVPISAAPSITFANRLKGATSFWHEVFVVPATAQATTLDAALAAAERRVAEAIDLRIGSEHAAIKLRHSLWSNARIDPVARGAVTAVGLCAAMLLAVVTVNLVVLSLVRLSERRRELDIRCALGASQRSLLFAVAIDTIVLVSVGVAAAWLLARSGAALLAGFDPAFDFAGKSLADLNIGAGALMMGLALGAAVLILVLIGPARVLLRPRLLRSLTTRAELASLGRQRLLAGTQFALASALTLVAAVTALAGWRAVHVPLGFDPERVLTARLSIPPATAPADGVEGFLQRIQVGMAAIPGVEYAATAACLPVHGGCDNVSIEAVPRQASEDWPVNMNLVAGDYFAAMGIRSLQGRWLDDRDDAQAAPVAVLSAAAARRYFPDRSPIGVRISVGIGWPTDAAGATIVGVVDDVLDVSLDAAPEPMVYLSALQISYNDNLLIVRAAPGIRAESLAPALANTLRRVQPELALWDSKTMEARFDGLTARRRLLAVIIGVLALVSLSVAAAGIFAVFALIVRRRRQEFGVRLALGATAARLRRSVMTEALWIAAGATVIGLLLGGTATQYAAQRLPGLLLDGGSLVFVTTLMLAVAMIACWWPARMASQADPNAAIRQE